MPGPGPAVHAEKKKIVDTAEFQPTVLYCAAAIPPRRDPKTKEEVLVTELPSPVSTGSDTGSVSQALLTSYGCCAASVARFAALFPNGGIPAVEAMTKARAEGLDVQWLAVLLPWRLVEKLRARRRSLFTEYAAAVEAAEVAYRTDMEHVMDVPVPPHAAPRKLEERAQHRLRDSKREAWEKLQAAEDVILVEMLTAAYQKGST